MRIRTSPKKMRPKEIALNQPQSLDPVLLKTKDELDQPRSAPPPSGATSSLNTTAAAADHLQQQHVKEFIFDYAEESSANTSGSSSEEEFSILEKCIRQYEVFFEIYLASRVLQIKTSAAPAQLVDSEKCRITVQLDAELSTAESTNQLPSVENVFKNEQVYEDENPERLLEIEKLFNTLRINTVSRTKQLECLLNRSLVSSSTALDSNSDFSDVEFRDCINNADQLHANSKHQSYEERIERNVQSLISLKLSSSLRNAVKLAANLLVEMSTFPNCNRNIVLDNSGKCLASCVSLKRF